MSIVVNIPETGKKRVVIIGAGFAGLLLAKKLINSGHQVVLFDKNNFHQFQPLFYQVAMAGLEPSSISFPLRKIFQKMTDIHIRMAEVREVFPSENYILTDIGRCNYDYLVIAIGAKTNYFGNQNIENHVLSLKTTSEAMYLRNQILSDLEKALLIRDYEERQKLLDIVIVGGGPTGVEIAGAIAELKHFILPKDYPELNSNEMDIHLIHGNNRLLPSMSEKSGLAAEKFLTKMGINIIMNAKVVDVKDNKVILNDGRNFLARKVIWTAGITGNTLKGIDPVSHGAGKRFLVDDFHKVKGYENIYAIGDISLMINEGNPEGHPQVAQVAMQQARNLAKILKGNAPQNFVYTDKGSLATIGRNKAVADLSIGHFKGFGAWILWLIVHLYALIGTRNKVFVLINWLLNYFTYDQSLRLILKPVDKHTKKE